MTKQLTAKDAVYVWNIIYEDKEIREDWAIHKKLYVDGVGFDSETFMAIKVEIPSLSVFCDSSVSFVWKSMPKIVCAGGIQDQTLATLREKTLKNLWKEYRIFTKMYTALIKATYLNEVIVRFKDDKANEIVYPEFLDPTEYRVEFSDVTDPGSRIRRIAFKKNYTYNSLIDELDASNNPSVLKNIEKVFPSKKARMNLLKRRYAN